MVSPYFLSVHTDGKGIGIRFLSRIVRVGVNESSEAKDNRAKEEGR